MHWNSNVIDICALKCSEYSNQLLYNFDYNKSLISKSEFSFTYNNPQQPISIPISQICMKFTQLLTLFVITNASNRNI